MGLPDLLCVLRPILVSLHLISFYLYFILYSLWLLFRLYNIVCQPQIPAEEATIEVLKVVSQDIYARDNVMHLSFIFSVFIPTSLLNSTLHGQLRSRLTVGKTPRPGGRF